MKISKSLLSAIAAGVLMTATVSCEKAKEENIHLETCDKNCKTDHSEENHEYYDCPGCGMG